MNPRLFLLYPLAEIATFIVVGKAIGVAATLALVVVSSVVGMTLLREAGLMTALRLERGREAPGKILAEGGTRMLAGLLLLIPGFLTDLAALAVLIPGVRKTIAGWLGPGKSDKTASHEIIEGEFRRLDR
ncbi:MAG TPA: FxsA family protein [Alphaproteobacteria bacterium]|nr:FxsA family protein [Alphaproteobacteria bacterium]